MDQPPLIFNRQHLRLQRERQREAFSSHDFLARLAAEQMAERLIPIKRRFPRVLALGDGVGLLTSLLEKVDGIETCIRTDLSPGLLAENPSPALCADEELLPFAPESFDAVFSVLNLNVVNDLPGVLIQIRRILKPDGLFMATLFGSETLRELREAAREADMAESGGITPRVAPFVDIRDAGGLLQRAGFALPVADNHIVTATYAEAFSLMRELHGMGAGNTLARRFSGLTTPRRLAAIAEAYHHRVAGKDGRIPASFEIITLTGWAPHSSQQKPAQRGSGKVSLADALTR